jgi:Ca2+-binding EF-hand superfamily protein
VAEIAAADQEKIKRGEEPLLPKTVATFFDIMDSDKDGFVSLEDVKLMLLVLSKLLELPTRTTLAGLG